MLVVVGQAASCKFELFRKLDRMRIVVAEHPRTVPIMEGQAVPDPMRNVFGHLYRPHLDFDPEAILLLQDAAIQVKQCRKTNVAVKSHPYQCISS